VPYDDAQKWMDEYVTKRHDAMLAGERMRWSTSGVGDKLEDLEKKFATDKENGEWKALTAKPNPDRNQLAAVLNKIAWLCGHRRDLRKQFMAAGSVQRTAVDVVRFEALRLMSYKKGLNRFKEMLKEREKGLTS
jgi:hypothetical protein